MVMLYFGSCVGMPEADKQAFEEVIAEPQASNAKCAWWQAGNNSPQSNVNPR
jgi:hypothetical protein